MKILPYNGKTAKIMKQSYINILLNTLMFDVLFPAFCSNCGKMISNVNNGLCNNCYDYLNLSVYNYNSQYLFNVEEKIHGKRYWYIDDILLVFKYRNEVSKLVYAMKFKNNKSIALLFANFLLQGIKSLAWDFDIITYIPVSKKRLWERGFNQSELMARYVGKMLHKNVFNLLTIKNENNTQKKLSQNDRFISTYLKFDILSNCTNIRNKSVLIVDDVYTTGATINECARILKMNGAKSVYASILAYAMLKDREI